MVNLNAFRKLFNRRSAILSFCLLWIAQALSPPVIAQQERAAEEIHLGIIVSATATAAEEVRNELNAGADFGLLAREKSIDPTSNSGGDLGNLKLAGLRQELREALIGIKAGQISKIVQIPSGFAILKILPAASEVEDLNPRRLLALSASGAIRFGPSVGGLIEADAVFKEYSKPDGWNRDLRLACEIRKGSRADAIQRIGQFFTRGQTESSARLSPMDLAHTHALLAQLHAYAGDLEESIAEWKAAYQIALVSVPQAMPDLQQSLGVSYLHLSEMENEVYRNAGDLCIFPPADPRAHYERKESSALAVQYLLKYLELKPDDLEAKWQLNLAYMTLGEYPSGVPAKHLIPPSSFASKESIGRFVDVAPAAGLNVFLGAGGVIADDFDNDGLLDLVVSSQDFCEPLHYFRNNGDGTFSNRSEQAGLADQLGGLNIVQADFNNDGCMDILTLRGGWEFPLRKSLLRNNCNGTFSDVTQQSGLGETVSQSQTATWADVDNDGYLDLFVGNENGPSQLFLNQGDGTFKDISHSAGIDRTAFTKGVAAADYDNDGYVDFYASNYSGANFLYHNNHNRTFTEVAKQARVQAPWFSFATWFFDYDNDGWPDLFVNSYLTSVSETMRSYLRLPPNAETLKLYRNLHDGSFADVTSKVGLDRVFMPMGANFGDIDNDGFLDIYLGMGQPSFTSVLPHVLLRNKEGRSFVDVTASSGTGELHKGHGIAFADLDRSGQEAIIAEIGGAVPADRHALRVFKNPGSENDWINVRLVGVKSNRAAVGARIQITVENGGQAARTIYRTVGSGSSFGGNPMEQHIGLGPAARIVGLDVWWPASNTRQHFSQVARNQFIEIKESTNEYRRLVRPSFRLGGANRRPAAPTQ